MSYLNSYQKEPFFTKDTNYFTLPGILCPRIISRTTASCGLSFLLAIIIPPDCVILSYISLEVYTNFGMGPFLTGNLLTLYYIPVREYHFLTLIINHYLNCRCFPTSLFCFLSGLTPEEVLDVEIEDPTQGISAETNKSGAGCKIPHRIYPDIKPSTRACKTGGFPV